VIQQNHLLGDSAESVQKTRTCWFAYWVKKREGKREEWKEGKTNKKERTVRVRCGVILAL